MSGRKCTILPLHNFPQHKWPFASAKCRTASLPPKSAEVRWLIKAILLATQHNLFSKMASRLATKAVSSGGEAKKWPKLLRITPEASTSAGDKFGCKLSRLQVLKQILLDSSFAATTTAVPISSRRIKTSTGRRRPLATEQHTLAEPEKFTHLEQ